MDDDILPDLLIRRLVEHSDSDDETSSMEISEDDYNNEIYELEECYIQPKKQIMEKSRWGITRQKDDHLVKNLRQEKQDVI